MRQGWQASASAVVAVTLLAGCQGSEAPAADHTPRPGPQSVPSLTEEERELYREAVRRLAAHETTRDVVVLSTRATSVKSFQDDAAEIVIERCVDLGAAPVIQTVTVERYENRTWRVGPVTTTDEPCGD